MSGTVHEKVTDPQRDFPRHVQQLASRLATEIFAPALQENKFAGDELASALEPILPRQDKLTEIKANYLEIGHFKPGELVVSGQVPTSSSPQTIVDVQLNLAAQILTIVKNIRPKIRQILDSAHHEIRSFTFRGNQVNMQDFLAGPRVLEGSAKTSWGTIQDCLTSSKKLDQELEEANIFLNHLQSMPQQFQERDRFGDKLGITLHLIFYLLTLVGFGSITYLIIEIGLDGFIFSLTIGFTLLVLLLFYLLNIFGRSLFNFLGKRRAKKIEQVCQAIKRCSSTVERECEAGIMEGERSLAYADAVLNQWEAGLAAQYKSQMEFLQRRLSIQINKIGRQISDCWAGPWNTPSVAEWDAIAFTSFSPAREVPGCLRLGRLAYDPGEIRPLCPNPLPDLSLPALIPFGPGQSLVVSCSGGGRQAAILEIQAIAQRLLASIPPGMLRFLLLDPIGQGQNMTGLLKLADFDEELITSKVWSEPEHIAAKLSEVTEHMENVIQKCMRHEYATIEEYNQQAGQVAVPYRLVVIMDFPMNFRDDSFRRLASIVQNGPHCGVYTLVHHDTDRKLPHGVDMGPLFSGTNCMDLERMQFKMAGVDLAMASFQLEQPMPAGQLDAIIQILGPTARDAKRVEVPFNKLLEMNDSGPNQWWRRSSKMGLSVPLGFAGPRKPQLLTFGRVDGHGSESESHALVVGRTGSGKSNLLHVIINSLSLTYSFNELQLYLIDFKQGVEFKAYADAGLPHACVIAIESEREFGLSILQRLNKELLRRGEMFRGTGVGLIEYRNHTDSPIPRIVLIVDEYQELFTREDAIKREALEILERIARQGRSCGIHMILSSQSLTGTADLPAAIRNQMAIRIALQCTESDSRQILAPDNPAARLLNRSGEAIYNSKNGLEEGNNFFQIAYFTDSDRDYYLSRIDRMSNARECELPAPVVFEGNESPRVEKCVLLKRALAPKSWAEAPAGVDAWIGEPVSLEDSVAVRFRRQSGRHLLAVMREETEGLGVLTAAILGLAAQLPPTAARFHVINCATADAPWFSVADQLAEGLPHSIEVGSRRNLAVVLTELHQIMQQTIDGKIKGGPRIFLCLQGLHRMRELRLEEGGPRILFSQPAAEPGPAELVATLLREGPEAGIHVLAWCDTYANAMRNMDRKSLGEIGMRVAGPMSNEDSMKFIDDAAASRLDKPHRAIFMDDDRPGLIEKFRPYIVPGAEWLEAAMRQIARRG